MNWSLKVQNHLMHSQITYNHSIWQEKDGIVTRFRKTPFHTFVPEKREEANNAMTNQQRNLLGLQVWWLLDVPQLALYLLVEDAATTILVVLDDAVDCKIPGAPLPWVVPNISTSSSEESLYVRIAFALLAITLVPAPEGSGCHCFASTHFCYRWRFCLFWI